MKQTNKIKYFVYLRKSSEGEDRQVQSIERQLDEVNKLARSLGIIFTEKDIFSESRSAKTPGNRPEFERMVNEIKKGKANGIICWHVSRLSRNPLEAGIIHQLLADGKILSIWTKEREYKPGDNQIIMSVESSMSSQYSRDLSKSVKSGLEKKLKNGIAPISAPLGYLNTKQQEHGSNSIIVDPERFPIVRKIWDMMLTNMYTPPQILEKANNEWGLRTRVAKVRGGKPISRSTIYRILTDPFYTGQFYYNGDLYQGVHKPMITMDEFDKVQIILGREGKARPKQHFFTYTGLIKCGECGCAITACEKDKITKTTGEFKKYILYYCTRRKKGTENCSQKKTTSLVKLESQIVEELGKITISKTFQDMALEVLREDYAIIAREEQAIYDSQLKELSTLETEIKNIFQMRIRDSIDDDTFKEETKDRELKIARLKTTLRDQEQGARKTIQETEDKFIHITRLKERFENGTLEEKKSIFVSLGWNYTLKDNKLFISKHNWINSVENKKEAIESQISSLELDNSLTIKGKSDAFASLHPVLRTLVDEVRTEIMKERHSLTH